MRPVLFGCSGYSLTPEESAFFREADPFGFILFQRNCDTPDQVRRLVDDLRKAAGRADAPLFIDQEGGRVARLKPPHWPALPPLRAIGRIYERDAGRGIEAMRLHARLTAHMLYDLGINGNCAPVLDLFIEGASSAIGDRAISPNPDICGTLGRVAVETYLENGVLPVVKHMPGHGRVQADPHLTLPVVETERKILEAEDFKPFLALKDAPIGMNCHLVFKALDMEKPVSLSAKVHQEIIRGTLGFKGLLFSDDLAMKALDGPLPEIAGQALSAGADVVLYCPGTMPEMREIAAALPEMGEQAVARWDRAKAMLREPESEFSFADAMARLNVYEKI
ncbi:MAG: glycoside hydrolase family 3 N-terminal domain-containing protein [Alphaproteobacteria bacterium]|nr:glycoside hydrolase family 3 N-terminal domain-containing protein [Alphaproteobacteria bacterium]